MGMVKSFPKTFDPEVDVLVRLMNRVAGVFPASSCGGHPNSGKNQCPEGEFFIIIRIENSEFLAYLKEITEGVIELEYSPVHETWCMSGFNGAIQVLEEVALQWTGWFGEKPTSDWVIFKSYCGEGVRL
jgi:hypothetical protein